MVYFYEISALWQIKTTAAEKELIKSATFCYEIRGEHFSLGKHVAIKAGNNQLMSEQFPLMSLLKCGACCDTSGNTTSVLCGKPESTIRLIAWRVMLFLNLCHADDKSRLCVFSIKMMQMKLDVCCAYASALGQLSRVDLLSITLCNESIKWSQTN